MFSDDELRLLQQGMKTEAYEQRKFIDSMPDKSLKQSAILLLKKQEKLQEKINSELSKTPLQRAMYNLHSRFREERLRVGSYAVPISKGAVKFWKEQELAAYSRTLKHIGKRLQQMGLSNG